jgi:hypothetical protein
VTTDRASRTELVAALAICAAAILPYLQTIADYFVRDDFGVVSLLADKPWSYFPRWFHTSWMDQIWGFTPDEVRPFPAVSYQLTALGGAASPILHHILNIAIHAVNGLLVFWIARTAASLGLPSATVAGLVFVVLPVHTESVAWITGRVDSMPAFFYLASFLAYVRWRACGSAASGPYLLSLMLFFVALFTKQNTITMVGTLVAYDVVLLRRSWRPLSGFVLPYVPFAAMTAGYLWVRYALFGQVAREGTLGADALANFGVLVERHLIHVVTGRYHGSPILLLSVLAVIIVGIVATKGRRLGALFYFGPIWWLIGVAPVAVAGYSSPRHVYLASVGWAIVLAIMFDGAFAASASSSKRRVAVAVASIVLAFYVVLLHRSVREWNVMAAVSRKAVADAHRAALAAPPGSLVVLGAPERSWAWALPFAIRPPFAPSDITGRVVLISPRALTCCTLQWFDETRAALARWSSGAGRDSVIALRWNEDTGELYRASSTDKPELPVLFRALGDLSGPDDVDTNIRRMLNELTSVASRESSVDSHSR